MHLYTGVALPSFVVRKVLVFTFWVWRWRFNGCTWHDLFGGLPMTQWTPVTWLTSHDLTGNSRFSGTPKATSYQMLLDSPRKNPLNAGVTSNGWKKHKQTHPPFSKSLRESLKMNMSRTTKGRKVPTFRPYCQIDPIRRGTALTKIFPEKKKNWWLIGSHKVHKQNTAQVGIIYWGNLKKISSGHHANSQCVDSVTGWWIPLASWSNGMITANQLLLIASNKQSLCHCATFTAYGIYNQISQYVVIIISYSHIIHFLLLYEPTNTRL